MAGALEAETWDSSVKSLVPFPQILRITDEQLDWTQELGMPLRSRSQTGWTRCSVFVIKPRLQEHSGPTRSGEGRPQRQGIVIEPANPHLVHPPIAKWLKSL